VDSEYVLMVSRDEEEERLRATSSTDEGVFLSTRTISYHVHH
jgi:hypothetical protein